MGTNGGQATVMQVLMWFVNALIVFVVAFLMMKMMGKRAIAQMSAFDVIVVFVLASMLSTALTDQSKMWPILVTGVFFMLIYMAASFLLLNNNLRKAIYTKPTVLISKGNINETGLRQTRMTVPELLGILRIKGYSSVADVEFAIMEEAGDISVIPKSQSGPVTPRDLNIVKAPVALPVPVIVDGEWIDDNLAFLQKDRSWMLQQLAMLGVEQDDVPKLTLVQVEPDGRVTIDRNEPAFQGKFQPGQFMSPEQASTAVMPSAASQPGISEATKGALAIINQQSGACTDPPKKQKKDRTKKGQSV
ncbi:DUF421 domain-containing protein [Effusibacillus pohliae]|uniref:DUF421 domain-containing protein n=1 Tax=Effusibacillus pohliae TaxID=232270 RepID=UPI000369E074|nr:DUF421 domain-containing protein [Effusibacillus pohliae]